MFRTMLIKIDSTKTDKANNRMPNIRGIGAKSTIDFIDTNFDNCVIQTPCTIKAPKTVLDK